MSDSLSRYLDGFPHFGNFEPFLSVSWWIVQITENFDPFPLYLHRSSWISEILDPFSRYLDGLSSCRKFGPFLSVSRWIVLISEIWTLSLGISMDCPHLGDFRPFLSASWLIFLIFEILNPFSQYLDVLSWFQKFWILSLDGLSWIFFVMSVLLVKVLMWLV